MRFKTWNRLDLEHTVLAVLLVPLVWAFVGWRPELSLAGGDVPAKAFWLYDEALRVGGDVSRMVYRPGLLGGVKLVGTMGMPLLWQLTAWLGVGPVMASNIYVVFWQVLAAVLGVRAALSTAQLWSPDVQATWTIRTGGVLLFAFAPALVARVDAGHLNFIGTAVFLWLWAVCAGQQAVTGSFVLLTFLTIASALSTYGHQVLLYAAVFAAPLWVWLGVQSWQSGQSARPRRLLWIALAVGGGAIAAGPVFLEMLRHTFGEDAARTLGEPVLYSYLPPDARDWLGSLTLGRWFVTHREQRLWHECHYGFGPLLLFALAIPWRRLRGLGLSCLALLALCWVLSENAKPLSDGLLALMPILGAFRVPGRCLVLVALMVLVLGIAQAAAMPARRSWSTAPWLLVIASAALPLWVLEPCAWIFCGASLLRRGAVPTSFGLVLAAVTSIVAARESLGPRPHQQELVELPRAAGAAAQETEPDLSQPLNRAVLSLGLGMSRREPNFGPALGISSLDGYWFAQRRFIELEAALSGRTYAASRMVFDTFGKPHWAALGALYNVCFGVRGDGSELSPELSIDRFTRCVPAWFSTRRVAVDAPQIASALHVAGGDPRSVLRDIQYTERLESSAPCQDASVQVRAAPPLGRPDTTVLEVRTSHDCPLTVAMNYSDTVRVRARSHGEWQTLSAYPAYVALLGALVPAGTELIEIEHPAVVAQLRPGWWLWIALAMLACVTACACRAAPAL